MPNIAGKSFAYNKKGIAAAAKELMKQKGKGSMVKRSIDIAKGGGLMKQNPFAKKKKSSAKSSTAKRTASARSQAQAKRSERAAGARAKARAMAARKKRG